MVQIPHSKCSKRLTKRNERQRAISPWALHERPQDFRARCHQLPVQEAQRVTTLHKSLVHGALLCVPLPLPSTRVFSRRLGSSSTHPPFATEQEPYLVYASIGNPGKDAYFSPEIGSVSNAPALPAETHSSTAQAVRANDSRSAGTGFAPWA